VGEADPRLLGVHKAISVPGVPDEVPPEYVPRDADAAEFGIRAKVEAAAQRAGSCCWPWFRVIEAEVVPRMLEVFPHSTATRECLVS